MTTITIRSHVYMDVIDLEQKILDALPNVGVFSSAIGRDIGGWYHEVILEVIEEAEEVEDD